MADKTSKLAMLLGAERPATLSEYRPTVRDKLARLLMGDDTRADSFRGQVVEGLLGSTGSGTARTGVVDFVPGLGQVLQAQEAGRQLATPGQRVAGAVNLGMALPIPGTALAKKAAGKIAQKAADEIAQTVEKTAPSITAYHGSPHKFDKFDASKIGTGEGVNAFGRGLYFAENEGVARSYRDALAGRIPAGSGLRPNEAYTAAAKSFIEDGQTPEMTLGGLKKAYPHASQEDLELAIYAANPGHMYQVNIKADPNHFLDWDSTLDRQSPAVREALGGLLGDDALRASAPDVSVYNAWSTSAPYDPRTGQSVYRSLGSKEAASEKLREAGIPGLKYLDQGSRGNGAGTRNYVVFDPRIIDIMKRYGVAAPVAAAVLAAEEKSKGDNPFSPGV